MPIANELPIDTSATADQMAAEIFGSGVTVNTASYSGDAVSSGIYTNADAIAPGVAPADSGVILSTGRADDITNSDGTTNTNQVAGRSTNTAGVDGDADFNSIAPSATQDAAFLEVTFTPLGDFLTIDFVISSEEYPEFANSQYNDVVGVWVNGQQATVTVGNGNASIGNINGNTSPNIYLDNTGDGYNTEMDGMTITLSFVAPVISGQINTLKIGVADVADANYDTNLLIAGGSVQSTIVAQDDSITMGNNDVTTLDVLANDSSTGGALTITHIQGQPVVVGQTIILGTGQEVTLNPDGTFEIVADGDDETIQFTYSIEDQNGEVDTALVQVTQVPCFVAGSLIDTPQGPRPIEALLPGDMILTQDDGPQPLRWIGQRTVPAEGANRPIHFRAGACGATQDLWLSPQHRVLVEGYQAELLYGYDAVFIMAKDMRNDMSVTDDRARSTVTYVHIMFDAHQVVTANGVACESYLPGPATMRGFDEATQTEILELFPELDLDGNGYGAAARPLIRSSDARALQVRAS